MPKWFAKIVEFLPADKKFLTSDSVSIFDFAVAGVFTNLICNPKSKNPAVWAATWEKAPERVKKYVADFNEDMKGYLDARPKDYSMWSNKEHIEIPSSNYYQIYQIENFQW